MAMNRKMDPKVGPKFNMNGSFYPKLHQNRYNSRNPEQSKLREKKQAQFV